MAVRLNDDKELVKTIREGLKRTGGYCPCRLERTEDNKCICKEFREQIADPNFKGNKKGKKVKNNIDKFPNLC